ncbi:uncharacterized protein LOC124929488 isoform X2 [Impatiens glandulifera]|uniref:uncharacterized protein LOC124929488 isoform X2 n=1 Tax=Impatiens glandulifera TaxID=253017 RepID=UPI001FB0F37B|nr:uncharacterized protein LOC124929488 isoform X2 [Impatiens glandulifera]
MSGHARDHALSLLAAANNHGDLAVKLSSLKQAKNILLSVDPSLASELFPYLLELQYSPERLVRKSLVEVVEEVNMKAMAHSSILVRALLSFLKDNDPTVVRQAIVSGTNIFCNVLEELWLQLNRRGFVERWLEELWTWMIKFKDAIFSLLWEGNFVGTKLLALKHMETYILFFTPETIDSKKSTLEATKRRQIFNISWMMGGHRHSILDPAALTSDASKFVGILLDMMQSASRLPGPLAIFVSNWWVALFLSVDLLNNYLCLLMFLWP